MITSEALLPSVNEDGNLVKPEQLLANHHLEDEDFHSLLSTAVRIEDLTRMMGGAIGLGRGPWPWLDEWAEQMDAWVDANGLLLPVPLDNSANEGGLEIIVQVEKSTPDHVDTFRHMPIGLSIGLQGRRELVSVGFDTVEEAFEAQRKLKRDDVALADLEEFEGRQVHRIIQEPGDVTSIAGYSTLHSGRPLEAHDTEGRIPNAVAIIGHVSEIAVGSEAIAQKHMDTYYRPSEAGTLRDILSGGNIVTSQY